MLRRVSGPLAHAIIELAEQAGPTGVAMGRIVDTLVREGHAAGVVEREIWSLLEGRRLTPAGFICRTIKRKLDGQVTASQRVYEFMLVPWSPALDAQLDLALERAP
jgi:hypothetical protein